MGTPVMMVRVLSLVSLTLALASCGPKAFTKGEYDDPQRVALLDDKFNEADMQQMADTIVQAMIACESEAHAAQKPVVAVEKVANRTELLVMLTVNVVEPTADVDQLARRYQQALKEIRDKMGK